MQILVLSLLSLVALPLTSYAAQSCKNGTDTGTCIATSSGCLGGEFIQNLCPGTPTDVGCCIKYAGQTCKNKSGQSGICQDKSTTSCEGGTYEAGFCQGPSQYKCCIKTCPEYFVVGVRGSSEKPGDTGNKGIDAMGATLSEFIGVASHIIPANAEYVGIPYPAILIPVAEYPPSETQGVETLLTTLKAEYAACPNAKIGIAGYSQGANVVNDALHNLETSGPEILDHIKAVLLLADPENDANQEYDVFITTQGTPAPKGDAHNGILGPQILPSQVRGVTSSFCFQGDIVCDYARTVPGDILEGGDTAIHSYYKSCCLDMDLPAVGGESFGNRMVA